MDNIRRKTTLSISTKTVEQFKNPFIITDITLGHHQQHPQIPLTAPKEDHSTKRGPQCHKKPHTIKTTEDHKNHKNNKDDKD